MHRQKRLVVWPLTCPWRLPLTATIACKTNTCSAFTIRSLHSTFPLRTSSSPSVAHETDLSCKTIGPTTDVLPLQQQQRQQQKQSKDYRTRIQRSLDKLVLRDLSCLLMASGLPLTGTKPVLANRLVTHLASIMDKVDLLEPEFFLHNRNNNNTNTNMYSSFSDNNSTPPPHSSFFSSTATTDTTSTPPPPAIAIATATGLKPPGHNHNSQNLNQIDPDVLARIKDKILPRSIVSMDIGIRNLAWVELSKDGEILRWAVEDLLVPSSISSDDSQVTLFLEDEEDGRPATKGSSSTTKPHRRGVAGSNTKQWVKKPPAPSYDPRAVALRVDKVMRTILEESQSVEGIILERQRFRSGGMHTMLDSTFKCGVVEGMIHTWFAFWQHEQQQQQQRRRRVMAIERDGDEGEEKEAVFIESVPPRAVAVRWGIGASGAKAAAAFSREKKKQQALVLDTAGTDVNENNAVSGVVEEGEVDLLTDSMSPALTTPAPAARAPKSLTYRHKKVQSRAIVDNWIYPSQDEQPVDPASSGATTESSSLSKFRVHCSPEMREWYSQEQKRDDLSDCLLQAVAWFEWRGRAVQEAVERSMPMPRCPVGGSVNDEEAAALRTGDLQARKVLKRRSPGKALSPSRRIINYA